MRLFVALEVPGAPRRELEERVASMRNRLPAARWVALGNVHLTLVFLGETAEAMVAPLSERLRPAFARCPVLDLQLADGGTFPPDRPARVAWVGMRAPQALGTLQREVTAAVATTLRLEPEARPFSAHVTVARCPEPWPLKAVENWKASLAGPIGPAFVAERGILVESFLEPKGARYREVATFPMGGGT